MYANVFYFSVSLRYVNKNVGLIRYNYQACQLIANMRSQHISHIFSIFFAHISSLTGPHILEKISAINWHA